ncbi:LysR family transcriptional regulator [Pelagimonas varians]|uniref:HTH-type transcriptional regulator GltR n=1 Tax=Pelagimonas varians TaxID=696760 RepID=A0A238KVF6_9RHOB|nr:LysR family transcriptional regulator [Pelagimonas varians]PYG32578.1 LysR family transcriptional regulator [Pelagimonas varians]SMX46016.1 HTH-type transcriptional regulator GltR [Pelagimonas varians]
MSWDDLRFFLAVAREGQILRAAQRLGTSQARVNRRITQFEEAVGAKLFDRRTVGCSLTRAGRSLMSNALVAEEAMLRLRSIPGDSDPNQISGTVRIGAPDGFGVTYLAAQLPKLRALYPNLKVQLVPAPRAFSLSQREADIAIVIGRPQKGRLKATKLTDYTLGLYAAKSYLAEHGTPQSIADLGEHELVGYVDDLIYTPELEFNKSFWPGWKSQIEISSALAQVTAVRSGAGIGVLHDFSVRDDVGLIPIFPETKAERSYWVVWHEAMDAIPHVAVTTRFIIETVRRDRRMFSPQS